MNSRKNTLIHREVGEGEEERRGACGWVVAVRRYVGVVSLWFRQRARILQSRNGI
jgi:hypothetical protein